MFDQLLLQLCPLSQSMKHVYQIVNTLVVILLLAKILINKYA